MKTRRSFLRGTAALLGGSALSASAPVFATGSNGQKFIVYLAMGGWDTTKIFWPPWDLINHDPEVGATERTTNGITCTRHRGARCTAHLVSTDRAAGGCSARLNGTGGVADTFHRGRHWMVP